MTERSDPLLEAEMRVLSTMSTLLAHASRLTEDVEETIGKALDLQGANEDWMVRDIQQLDLLRQMQADLSRVLEHLSANRIDLSDLEDLSILNELCKVGIVRDAIHASVDTSETIHDPQDQSSEPSGQVQLF